MGCLYEILHGNQLTKFSLIVFLYEISDFDDNINGYGCIGRNDGGAPGIVLNWDRRVNIAYGAARGLEYLHEKVKTPIVRCDVRSSNVLVFEEFESN